MGCMAPSDKVVVGSDLGENEATTTATSDTTK